MCNCQTPNEPFKYGDRVKIVSGFYQGLFGTVVDKAERTTPPYKSAKGGTWIRYTVQIEADGESRTFKPSEISHA